MVKKLWNKNFVLLLQSSAVSTIGDLMYSIAIGFWVYSKTGSSALMGIMSSISMLVTMFLSPFSGSIVDKCNRKWVIVAGDFFQGALMLTIGALAFMDKLSIPGVLIAAFLASLGGVFYSPAVNTSLIDIIPHDDMVRGQSLFSGMSSVINTVGSAFSGAMIAFLGVPVIIVINGLSNVYAAVSELFVSIPKTAQEGEAVSVKGVLRDTKTAVIEIFSDTHLKLFVPCTIIINLIAAGPMSLLLPFVMEKGFTVAQYGYLITVFTIGSLLSVILLGIIKLNGKARFWTMSICFLASVVSLALAFSANRFIPMCVFGFFGGFFNAAGNTVFSSAMMLALPEKNRGAILGFLSSACVGGSALSVVIYGFLGEIAPLSIVFVVGNLLSLVPMMVFCLNKKTKEFITTH